MTGGTDLGSHVPPRVKCFHWWGMDAVHPPPAREQKSPGLSPHRPFRFQGALWEGKMPSAPVCPDS